MDQRARGAVRRIKDHEAVIGTNIPVEVEACRGDLTSRSAPLVEDEGKRVVCGEIHEFAPGYVQYEEVEPIGSTRTVVPDHCQLITHRTPRRGLGLHAVYNELGGLIHDGQSGVPPSLLWSNFRT